MPRLVSIHSFRGGTGKSNTTANLACHIAARGHRVGIIDTDVQSPGIHVLFNLETSRIDKALNDYLRGDCLIDEAAYDVTPPEVRAASPAATMFLIPSSINSGEIARILHEGYDVARLNDGIRAAIDALKLDYLLIDTHPGVNEETLLSIAVSDALVLVMRPDHQDYQGTAVTIDLARRLAVPSMLLVVNKVPSSMAGEQVRQKVEATFGVNVAAVLPLCEEMVAVGSESIFSLRYPDHPLTGLYRDLADTLMHAAPVTMPQV